MKRNFIIRNIIIGVLLIVIIASGVYYFIKQNSRKYEIEKVEQYNYFVLKQDNLSGVINRNGNKIIDVQYDDVKIPNPEKSVFICYKSDEIKVFNEKEEILSEYEKVEPIRLKNIASNLMYEKSVLQYYENGKYGLINYEGKKITKPIYDSIEGLPYKEGELLVKQNDKYGVINIKGNKMIDIAYDQISIDGYYTEKNEYKYAGYIVANKMQEGYRYGYINKKGNLILNLEYNQLSRITDIKDDENIYLIGAKNGQFGVTKNGKDLIPNEYQSISYDSSNELLVVEKSKKYGIATLNGEVIIPTQYSQIDVVGIYLYAQNEQGTTVYNNDGTEANINRNIEILNTGNEKYKIRINNENGTKYGVIAKDGKQIIEEKYNYIEYLYDDYFIVSNENSKLGVINDKDTLKIEIENDSLQKVENTDILQAFIVNNNTTKLYAKDMSKICEMQNATVEVKNDYIVIYNDEETKYFSREGKELNNTEIYISNTLFAKKENGKWGFVDKDGNLVVEAKYDKVTEFNEYGFAAVKINGKWGSINTQGKEVIEPSYELKEDSQVSFIGIYYQVKYGFGEVYYTDAK